MSSYEQTPGAGDWLHFAGVAGSGMSALAQFHVQQGGLATGSDRALDQFVADPAHLATRDCLLELGVRLVPQDGSFLRVADGAFAGRRPAALVVSTAVEDRVPDVKAARSQAVPVLHRSELLARYVAAHRTIAVSGTSGKSTVTAMVFVILQAAGLEPGLLTGGALAALVAEGQMGNAWAPGRRTDGPPWLVIEADESDGSLVRYRPWAGVILNLGLDHKEPVEIMRMFATFRDNVAGPLIVGDTPELAPLLPGSTAFGVGPGPGLRAENISLRPDGSSFTIGGTDYQLQVPGLYNVLNALAAVAAAGAAGVPPAAAVAPLAAFTGVARRFQSVGSVGGVEVIDDFAHNPDKIAAALAAGHTRAAGRVLAVFQPHGFGPTRFLREALVETFATCLAPDDVLWMPEIYFAGGTATRDISSAELTDAIAARGRQARFTPSREELPAILAETAVAGDVILVMGARDPSLTTFCRDILAVLAHGQA